jgi:hypothetical protein
LFLTLAVFLTTKIGSGDRKASAFLRFQEFPELFNSQAGAVNDHTHCDRVNREEGESPLKPNQTVKSGLREN